MRHIYNKVFISLIIVTIIFISGCTSQTSQQPVCGNSVLESSEECDKSACPIGKICSAECKCEVVERAERPSAGAPPPLPE